MSERHVDLAGEVDRGWQRGNREDEISRESGSGGWEVVCP